MIHPNPLSIPRNPLHRGAGWLALCLMLAGCAGPQERTLARLERIADAVMAAPCDAPRYDYRLVDNAHVPGVTDQVEILRCPGLEARTYWSRESARPGGLPVFLLLTRPHPGLPAFLQPGSPGEGLERQLGRPTERHADYWRYGSVETTEAVTISWRDGRIRQLRWEWYLD
ncbi:MULTISPECIES: hypothetical protein [Oceanimonas]|uniref:Uncharacterized protein n=1 Tax=Oceanimonas doudoroffii TaxID=84158 RepID=A0A233RHJ8_9GAMM|nr:MULTISPECIES: hypothetical protein [Oceanimonas]NHI00537.1 hypothetical protein [Oceanimonas sp. MB9]OXY82859.1 hypothetical protein B6S08_04970 [Oceanimonas doudoroffii]